MNALSRAWEALCRNIVLIDKTIVAHANRLESAQDLPSRAHPWRRLGAQGSAWIRDWHSERERAQDALRARRRAERRALTLLLGLLNADQRHDFREHGHIHVTGASSGSRYRIRAALFANIDVLACTGAVAHRLCVQPTGELPMYDVMAGQMLYLQDPGAEEGFLGLANIHPTRPDDYVPRRPG